MILPDLPEKQANTAATELPEKDMKDPRPQLNRMVNRLSAFSGTEQA